MPGRGPSRLRDDTRCPARPASGEDPSGRDEPDATSLKYLRLTQVWHRPRVGKIADRDAHWDRQMRMRGQSLHLPSVRGR